MRREKKDKKFNSKIKKLSIKARVTLWYTLFMAVLTCVILFIVFSIGWRQISESVREQLIAAVSEAVDDIEYNEDGGGLNLSNVSRYKDGVFILIYDSEGYYMRGQLPSNVVAADTPNFYEGYIQSFSAASSQWLSYDLLYSLPDGDGLWVRGIVSQTYADSSLDIIVRLTFIVIPVFIVLILIGGYIVTKRAFAPVQKIRDTAEEISKSNDLTRRIGLGGGNDEIYMLADTFDTMLDRIEQSFEREKQFTTDVSHELRTPISVISAQAEYALINEVSKEEQEESLRTILDQSRKMSSLVSQLLTLSRAERGAVKLNLEKINLSELLELIAEEEADRAQSRKIEIVRFINPGVFINADKTLLMRCFINLLENAIVYGNEGGHIWIYLTRKGNKASGYVRDDGIGISQEDLPKIWERFYQVDPARSSMAEGNSGLGLSMVNWIVKANNGTISVESTLGEGTVFNFEFDAVDA